MIAAKVRGESEPVRSLNVASALYLPLPPETRLWVAAREHLRAELEPHAKVRKELEAALSRRAA